MFLAIGGALSASVFSRLHGPLWGARDLLQRIGILALYSAVAAVAYLLFVDTASGALTGHAGWLFLAAWGYTLAIALAASGISALLGTAAGLILTLLFTVLGNPSAGGAIGRPLLNRFFSALNPIFPHGSGLSSGKRAAGAPRTGARSPADAIDVARCRPRHAAGLSAELHRRGGPANRSG